MTRPPTFDHLQKKTKPTKRLTVVLDDDLAQQAEAATRALSDAQFGKSTKAEIARLEGAVKTANAAVAEASVVLVFRSIGRRRYDEMVDEHPPTDEQQEKAKEQGGVAGYNPATFLPVLISESLIEPLLTLEQVNALWDEWNNAEVMALINAAIEVNTTRRTADLGKG